MAVENGWHGGSGTWVQAAPFHLEHPEQGNDRDDDDKDDRAVCCLSRHGLPRGISMRAAPLEDRTEWSVSWFTGRHKYAGTRRSVKTPVENAFCMGAIAAPLYLLTT